VSQPVEIRFFVAKASMEDIENGMPTQRIQIGPNAFGVYRQPPLLQYRYKEKTFLNGAPAVEWSDWVTIPIVREGEEAAALKLPPQQD
jgi:hypothetical protein